MPELPSPNAAGSEWDASFNRDKNETIGIDCGSKDVTKNAKNGPTLPIGSHSDNEREEKDEKWKHYNALKQDYQAPFNVLSVLFTK